MINPVVNENVVYHYDPPTEEELKEKPHVCEICWFCTKWPFGLKRHKFMCHGIASTKMQRQKLGSEPPDNEEEKIFQCSQCSFKTKYKVSLRRHECVIHEICRTQKDRELCERQKERCRLALEKLFVSGFEIHDFSKKNVIVCIHCGFKSKEMKEIEDHQLETHSIPPPPPPPPPPRSLLMKRFVPRANTTQPPEKTTKKESSDSI